MKFTLATAVSILKKTPELLSVMLGDIPSSLAMANEGENTWSVFDIVGHLVHGEKTDWMVRAEIILSENVDKRFTPFDRFAQYETSTDKSLKQLLLEFQAARHENIEKLLSFDIDEEDLVKKGIHPAFGEVTLAQLLATWVVHDFNHISQVSRVVAKQYKNAVGPWINYLRVLQ